MTREGDFTPNASRARAHESGRASRELRWLRRVVDSIQLGPHAPFTMTWSVHPDDASTRQRFVFSLVMHVRDRESGQPTTVHQRRDIWIRETSPDEAGRVIGQVRYMIREALEHELDEHLLVRGERVFDPHRREYDEERVAS